MACSISNTNDTNSGGILIELAKEDKPIPSLTESTQVEKGGSKVLRIDALKERMRK